MKVALLYWSTAIDRSRQVPESNHPAHPCELDPLLDT